MASIKVKFRPSQLSDSEGTIFYQLIHERKVRHIGTDYHVYPYEWDDVRSTVTTNEKGERYSFILSLRDRIRWDMERLAKIVKMMDSRKMNYSVEDIVDEFRRYASEYSIFNYMENIIARLRQTGHHGTARAYNSTLCSFKRFRNEEDVMLDCITPELMEDYAAWLKSNGNIPNTISFYCRILKAIYLRAVENDITLDRHPFRKVYTGIDKTIKRALSIPLIKKIKELDLSLNPGLALSRDMFILSFYLRGMSFIDMAFLKKTDLKDNQVTYRRHKTGQLLTIAWTKEMQQIVDRYPENPRAYLLPILTKEKPDDLIHYYRELARFNRNLKLIGKLAGITVPISSYYARHSWANAARVKRIPISVISEGMGHDSEATTQIYLSSLDTGIVDKANRKIISSIE